MGLAELELAMISGRQIGKRHRLSGPNVVDVSEADGTALNPVL
ncbi:MAG: hypothetical protein R8G34_03740 [Paracoccaceae bacterium]|nr:hypothetical protein [Paracoccaceae bacterium]